MSRAARALTGLVTALWVAGCQSGSGPSDANMGTVEQVDTAGLVDTVDAPSARQLTLRVLDLNGSPLRGVAVQLRIPFYITPDTSLGFYPAYPQYDDSTGIEEITGFLDDAGLARFTFQRNGYAGTFPLIVSVRQIHFTDTLDLVVQPGHAVALAVIPGDTALHPRASLQLRAATVDRYGNPRADPVAYVGSGPLVQVSGSGRVTAGAATGRDSVMVEYPINGTLRRAAGYLSIVPPGTLAVVTRSLHGPFVATVDLDGSGLRLITPVSPTMENLNSLTWTSDGSTILFADTGGLFRVSVGATPARSAFGDARPGYNPPVEGELSQDGSVLVTTQNPSFGNVTVFTHDSAGQHPTLLTPRLGLGLSYYLAWKPSPSPDGSRVAVITDELNGGLRVIDAATGLPLPWLTSGQRPRWSPDGSLIAFIAQGNGPLRVISPDGTGERAVSPAGVTYLASMLGWSADGQWLIARDDSYRMHLVNVAGGFTLPLGYTDQITDAAIRP